MFKASILVVFYFFFPQRGSDNHKITFRVMPWHLDLYGHVNNSYYLKYCNRARLVFLSEKGILKSLLKRKVKAVISRNEIDYKKSLKIFQKFTVQTKILEVDGRKVVLTHKLYQASIEVSSCTTSATLIGVDEDSLKFIKEEFHNE
jgi:YbgC/YbaW family acyl-CoA thioester hydrolase